VDDRLTNKIINNVVQTPNCFLSVVTGEGLARFDGRHFERLKFSPEVVRVGASAIRGRLRWGAVVTVLGGVTRIPAEALDLC
jgi:hypothetical protein